MFLKNWRYGNIVKIGTQSNGQGHSTSYAQIVSEVLEVNINEINVIQGNSVEIAKVLAQGI